VKSFYLFAAVIGAIVPGIFFLQFIQFNGLDLPAYTSALFVNGAAGGFSSDLLISSLVFWGYLFQQAKNNSAPRPWLFVALNLGIGLSCALPAYLYAREKAGDARRG